MTPTDPASPLVLDTKPLGRRAGAMVELSRSFEAPTGWAVSSAEVVAGTPAELDLRLESVVEGVLVTGTATAMIEAECSRCLDTMRRVISVSVQQLFEYPADGGAPSLDEDGEPIPALQGDLLDLEPLVRDAVLLDLPAVPLCAADCAGLCPACGFRLAEDPAHHHDEVDQRWDTLQDWLSSNEGTSAPQGQTQTQKKGE